MVKKVREYKSGDFIFAKVKGYPAWPARVQRMNGKKYFVYFYGTGETANLPPNMIFDYAENKDKFLTKTVKRRDFNNGVKQIEHDFANNVPLEQVIGINPEVAVEAGNETANDSAINVTMDDAANDTTAADDTVIDEPKGRKSKVDGKIPVTPAKMAKEPKTPRGKAKKEEPRKEDDDDDKKEDEIVSRSGRKIRPKRYIDEQTEDNATLPSPAPKKRRGASPASDKDKDIPKEKEKPEGKETDKNIKHFTAVVQSELEDLEEPFKSDPEKDNILIAYLPSGQYVGIKLFQSRPANFKNENSRLEWDKQAAANSITLKQQLEKGHITSQSVITQLVMDLNLTDEEKATLDREREMEEKKSRVQFLKTEMKLIELDAKIKTCLSLEKADTDLCLKLLDELIELDVKPLMLLKHPTCLETVKRMRAYVGNTPSWDLSESAAIVFSKQAHRIRKQADTMYKNMKELFTTPEGLSFWEFFSERVLQFKKVTSNLTADELLELVHEPSEMSVPTAHTMKSAVEAANEESKQGKETNEEDEQNQKKKNTPVKAKKSANNTKTPLKRQSSRKLQQEEKAKDDATGVANEVETAKNNKVNEKITDKKTLESELDKELGAAAEKMDIDDETGRDSDRESVTDPKETENAPVDDSEKNVEENDKISKDDAKSSKDSEENSVKDNEEIIPEEKAVEEKEKEKEMGEPRVKRTRETKKTEAPPPRSPAKRKAKC